MGASIDKEKWQVLLKRDFFLLTFGRVGSALGSKVFAIGLMWWMLENRGAGSAGVVTALTLIGAIVLRPLGGVFVDRVDRRWSLVSADTFGAVFVAVLAVGAMVGSLGFGHFVLAIVATSLSSAIITPATRSLIGEVLTEEELTAGNSVMSSLTNIASLAGPALAGALLAVFSYELVFALNAASFGVAAVAELFMRTTSSEAVTDDDDSSVVGDLREGFEYIAGDRRIRRIMVAAVSINFFATPLLLIGPALIERNGYSAFYAGLTETLFAVGAIIAGITLVVLAESGSVDVWETELFGGLAFVGVIFFAGAGAVFFFPELILPIVLATVFLISVGSGIADIKADSIVQASAPDEQMGRVFGTMKTAGNVAMPLSIAVTGFVVELVGAVDIFLILAAGVVLTVVVVGHRQVYALLTRNAISPDGEVISRETAD
jgi:DHA3 family macrolide efflux protein-like MFS transporter